MLKGACTGLRAVEKSDLEQLLRWRNQPEFRKFFREYRELNMTQQHIWYETSCLKDDHTIMFSIVELPTMRLLGAAGLCRINWIDRNADFSIYIGADGVYIDSRFAPDAGRTLIRYAFEELCLHRLWAEIYSIDDAKQILLPSLGFSMEGRHRGTHWTEGRWVDSLFFSLLEDDYHRTNDTQQATSDKG
ncbi:MAG: GNAT family N-acetyltransferase [Thermodesulfobacteriota bacterium]